MKSAQQCPACGTGMLRPGKTSVTFERDGQAVVISGVPADICDRCDEWVIDAQVLEQVEARADRAFAAGAGAPTIGYQAA